MENFSVTGCGNKLIYCAAEDRYALAKQLSDGSEQLWQVGTPHIRFADGRRVNFPAPKSVERRTEGTLDGVRAVYTGFEDSEIEVHTFAWLEQTNGDIYFEVRVENDKECELDVVSWPGPILFEAKEGEGYTVLSRMQGTLVPAGMNIPLGPICTGCVLERDSYMPMYGQVWGKGGYLGVYDTPYDVKYEFTDGKVIPLWRTSLGHLAYPRRMLYRMLKDCDYNDIAHAYRDYAEEMGRIVTLREKMERNPNLRKLPGCAVIHSDIAHVISSDSEFYDRENPENNDRWTTFDERARQIHELHQKGLKKGYTHFDGWGKGGYDRLHPSPFPPHQNAGGAQGMKRLGEAVAAEGYIFGIHDQYRDYYYEAPDFDIENAMLNIDGSRFYCSVWEGGKQTVLCAAKAPEYVRRNFDHFERLGIPIQAAYLDVFGIITLDECNHPDHRMTRKECVEYRRRCFDILTQRGIIPSSEEPAEIVLESIALVHHAPYYTKELGEPNSEMSAIAIPLFNLVYHDSIIVPWIGDKGTRGGWCIPKTDSGYAHALLNGNPIYCDIDADEAQVARVNEVCALSEKLTHCQMVRHEFVSEDRRIQRTTFSDGTVVEVNFDTEEFKVSHTENI